MIQMQPGRNVKRLNLLFSICSLLGCSGLPKPSINQVRIPDLQHSVCTVYQVIDPIAQTYKKIDSLSLKSCDGIVGLTPQDFKLMQNWFVDVNSNYTCKKKQ